MIHPDDNALFDRLQQLSDDARRAFNEGARGIPLNQPLDADTALAGFLADHLQELIPRAYEAYVRNALNARRAA